MKKRLYLISFLVLFAVPFQAQQAECVDSFIAEAERRSDGWLRNFTDVETTFRSALASRRSVHEWWNPELARYLERFTDYTGIMVGIRCNLVTPNPASVLLNMRRWRGTYRSGTDELALLFNLAFQRALPIGNYQIGLALNNEITPEMIDRTYISDTRWGSFRLYLDDVNDNNTLHQSADFEDAVNRIITDGLYILSGIRFPAEGGISVNVEWISQFDIRVDGRDCHWCGTTGTCCDGGFPCIDCDPCRANNCCMQASLAMIEQFGITTNRSRAIDIATLLSNENWKRQSDLRAITNEFERGVSYIDESLRLGRPVLIGVHFEGRATRVGNRNSGTFHFMVIVGKVYRNSRMYYRFYDPGRLNTNRAAATDENNLLRIDKSRSMIHGVYRDRVNTITEIRRNL